MAKQALKPGSVIKIKDVEGWVGCLAEVYEISGEDVKAFIVVPNEGKAFINLRSEQFDFVA